MAFPETAIITNFTGTDENPISEGGIWAGPLATGHSQAQRISNQMGGPSGYWSSYLVATRGPDCEVYMTLTTLSTNALIVMMLKMTDPNSAVYDGYSWLYDADPGVFTNHIRVITNGSEADVGATFTQQWATGDSVGFRCQGDQLTVWRKPSGSAWDGSPIATRTDSTFQSQSGVIAIVGRETTWRFDDLGGGTVVGGVATGYLRYRKV